MVEVVLTLGSCIPMAKVLNKMISKQTRLLEKLYCFEIILFNKAVEFYQKACDLNHGKGCSNLGLSYVNGKGVKQDDFKAVYFFNLA
jgi:TPR repeat protein